MRAVPGPGASGCPGRRQQTLTRAGQSWSSKVNSPLPEVEGGPGARGYSGGFQTKLMLKVSARAALG